MQLPGRFLWTHTVTAVSWIPRSRFCELQKTPHGIEDLRVCLDHNRGSGQPPEDIGL